MHVYIAPEPGNPILRCCTVLLSLTQNCFHPAHIPTPKGAYNACCHYRRKALLKHITITSCQVLIFMDDEPAATWQHCSSRRFEPATLRLRVLRYHGSIFISSVRLLVDDHRWCGETESGNSPTYIINWTGYIWADQNRRQAWFNPFCTKIRMAIPFRESLRLNTAISLAVTTNPKTWFISIKIYNYQDL